MKAKHVVTLTLAIAIAIAIASILAITLFLGGTITTPPTQPQQKPSSLTVPVNTQRKKPASLRWTKKAEKGSPRFQDTEFYRTIVDNNLSGPSGGHHHAQSNPIR